MEIGKWKMENNRQANFDFFDFSHDSAKQASLMALAAPKVQISTLHFQLCEATSPS